MHGVEKSAVCYKVLQLQHRVFVLLVQVNWINRVKLF